MSPNSFIKPISGKLKSAFVNKSLVEGLLFSGFSFINRGFVFLLLIILANFISPADYGYLNLFNTVVMVTGYFIALSTEGYFSISYFNRTDYNYKQAVSGIILISIVISSILLTLMLLDGIRISSFLSLPQNCIYIAIAISFFTIFQNLNLDFYRLQKKVWQYGIISCSNALINFVLSILLVKSFSLGWEGRIDAQLTTVLLYAAIAIIIFVRSGFFVRTSWDCIKKMMIWGIPLIPHHATNFLRQGCDRYIINAYYSIDDVGLFSFALNLSNIIMMIGVGFNQSNSVDIYKVLSDDSLDNNKKKSVLSHQRRNILILYIVFSLLVVLAILPIVPILLPQYSGSIQYFVPLSLYGLFQCFYFLYTNYLFYYKKTKTIMMITVSSALLHLILSLILTRYSLMFTCMIYILSQGLVCLLIKHFAQKELLHQFHYKRL